MSNKIDIDKVREKLLSKFDCELISTSIPNCESEIEIICNKHREHGVQKIKYSKTKKNNICIYCGQEHIHNSKALPTEEIIRLTNECGMEYVNHYYKNGKCVIQYICPNHQDKGIQTRGIGDMRNKHKCPYCVGKNMQTDDFVERIYNLNPNIEILGEYIDAKTPIKCRCKVDGTIWYPIPNNLSNGEGCPTCGKAKCSASRCHTNEWFIKSMQEIHPDIEYNTSYTTAKEKIHCKCNICGHEWDSTPDNLINGGHGCPNCAIDANADRSRKSNEEFVEQLKLINPHIMPMEKYVNNKTKILCKCKIHDYQWFISPNKILYKKVGCPLCSLYYNEYVIKTLLNQWGIKYTPQFRFDDCRDKNPLPFDFRLDDYGILIEYDGEQHDYPVRFGDISEEQAIKNFQTTVYHDYIKTEYCKKNKIPLIRISHEEKEGIEYILFDQLVKYNVLIEN